MRIVAPLLFLYWQSAGLQDWIEQQNHRPTEWACQAAGCLTVLHESLIFQPLWQQTARCLFKTASKTASKETMAVVLA
jgi:hypothetical protein